MYAVNEERGRPEDQWRSGEVAQKQTWWSGWMFGFLRGHQCIPQPRLESCWDAAAASRLLLLSAPGACDRLWKPTYLGQHQRYVLVNQVVANRMFYFLWSACISVDLSNEAEQSWKALWNQIPNAGSLCCSRFSLNQILGSECSIFWYFEYNPARSKVEKRFSRAPHFWCFEPAKTLNSSRQAMCHLHCYQESMKMLQARCIKSLHV